MISPYLFINIAVWIISVQILSGQTPSPNQVISCYKIPSAQPCENAPINGCFTSTTCAKCNWPTQNPNNDLRTCEYQGASTEDMQWCHEENKADCFAPNFCGPDVANLSKPFKTARKFTIENQCTFPVWIGLSGKNWTSGNFSDEVPANGGFKMNPQSITNISIPVIQSGIMWARTNCNWTGTTSGFTCDTGSCSNVANGMGVHGNCCGTHSGSYQCGGPKGAASLVEFTLGRSECINPNDNYDVSVIGGYNVPVSIQPFDYEINETVNYKKLSRYACGIASINAFDVERKCPPPLIIAGSLNRDGSSYSYPANYCYGICEAVNSKQQRDNHPLLSNWYTADAYTVLTANDLYEASTVTSRVIEPGKKNLVDLLCCQCTSSVGKNGCFDNQHDESACAFGCTSFLDGGWNSSNVPAAWDGTRFAYKKRECPNYGYKTKDKGLDKNMPLWPLLNSSDIKEINPAYIYKNSSPDAYSWQFNDKTSTFQCRNADYKITFCHEIPIVDEVETASPTDSATDSAYAIVFYGCHVFVFALLIVL